MRKIIYPSNAGVASAFGLIVAPMSGDFVQTYQTPLDAVNWKRFNSLFQSMEQRASAAFKRGATKGIQFKRALDFRYVGQGFEIQVEIPEGPYTADFFEVFRKMMLSEYERVFNRLVEGVPLEIVNLRLFARAKRGGAVVDFDYQKIASGDPKKGSRKAYFHDFGDYVETGVYDRDNLVPGIVMEGPVIIEEKDTTIVIPPHATAEIDEFRNVIATLAPAASRPQK